MNLHSESFIESTYINEKNYYVTQVWPICASLLPNERSQPHSYLLIANPIHLLLISYKWHGFLFLNQTLLRFITLD